MIKKHEGHKFIRQQNGLVMVKKYCPEKRHQTQNIIHEVLGEDNFLTEDDDILGAMCDYFENLYSLKLISNEDIDLYLNNC